MFAICKSIFAAGWRKNHPLRRSLRREWRLGSPKGKGSSLPQDWFARQRLTIPYAGKRSKMQNVPNIVRDRLKAATAVSHPDADTLTAFSERLLPGAERAVVLEHLARCGD